MSSWGIDISNHQAGANLAAAKAAGAGFVFAKATEGLTYTDDHYADFRAKAKAAGLPFGAYHFARPQPGRTGAQEAAHFLSVHKQQPGDLPPVLDLEDTKLSASATVAFALDWLTVVQKATGVRPILYTYSAFASQHLGSGSALAAYPLWLANYRSTPPPAPSPWSAWTVWQHSSSATVPGIPGNCDRNIAGPGFPPTNTPSPTAQETDMQQSDVQDIWTAYPIVKNVTVSNPDAPRVAPSFLLELAAKNSVTTVAQLAGLTAAVKALAESKPGVNADQILATVKSSVDAGVTAALADLSITLSNNQGA
jgi:GH25 family lysozyme M1 (1,4-beta-N-acetylmuramidase)